MLFSTAVVAIALLILLAGWSILRRKRDVDFELIPNQLLTRKPVVFLSGDRSIFYFTRYWNQIPSFLTEHGFEVYKAPLPWKKGADRRRHLQKIFTSWEQQNFSCHLFADTSLFAEISEVVRQNPSKSIASLNLVCADMNVTDIHPLEPGHLSSLPIAWRELHWTPTSFRSPFYWRAHQILTRTQNTPQQLGIPLEETTKRAFLEHLKVLAERDFTVPN